MTVIVGQAAQWKPQAGPVRRRRQPTYRSGQRHDGLVRERGVAEGGHRRISGKVRLLTPTLYLKDHRWPHRLDCRHNGRQRNADGRREVLGHDDWHLESGSDLDRIPRVACVG